MVLSEQELKVLLCVPEDAERILKRNTGLLGHIEWANAVLGGVKC